MNFKLETHHLIVEADGTEMLLRQMDFSGNEARIAVSKQQLLALADKVRGITRPDPEAELSRKLKVVATRLNDTCLDEQFRETLISGQGDRAYSTDWLERLDCLNDLLWEFAYGLLPYFPGVELEPEKTNDPAQSAGGKANTTTTNGKEQGDLLED